VIETVELVDGWFKQVQLARREELKKRDDER
jgi:hypothetical protein